MDSRLLFVGSMAVAFGLWGCSSEDGRDGRGNENLGEGTGASTGSGGGDGSGGNVLDPGEIPDPEPEECDSILQVVYRDFKADHPDFEMSFAGDVVRLQLVQANLGADQKPVFNDPIGCPPSHDDPRVCDNWFPTEPVIQSAETFDQWYRDVPDVNITFERELELVETPAGSGKFVYDSDAFFPLGPEDGWGIAPTPDHHLMRNFLFTTEIHVRFKYVLGQVFTFRGDDDLWIFVNGKLALDLGSMHTAVEGTIDFDALAADLGISPGGSYNMDIFHAERHTSDSNFRVETNISCFEPVVVR